MNVGDKVKIVGTRWVRYIPGMELGLTVGIPEAIAALEEAKLLLGLTGTIVHRSLDGDSTTVVRLDDELVVEPNGLLAWIQENARSFPPFGHLDVSGGCLVVLITEDLEKVE